ncbi:MAG: acyl-CoA thioesterase [Pseudomonadota bacterium]|nr:acyl-CoA thioesterase [Pseudomonadota bacterium]
MSEPLHWDYPAPHTIRCMPAEADIDGLNHTNNGVYVRWCQEAGWSHSRALGLSLQDYQTLDRAMAIRRGEYDYLLATALGEPLLLATWLVASDKLMTMERRFQLVRQRDGATVLRGRWMLVCIEISSGRPRRMPPAFTAAYLPAVVDVGGTGPNVFI